MSTPVTVTRPIRGSFSSGSASASTWRTDSFTRRIRSVIGHIQASARARPRSCRRLVLHRGARRRASRARPREHPAARCSCSSARIRRPRRERISRFPGSPPPAGSIGHIRARRVDWRLVAWMLPPSVVGASLGGFAAGHLPANVLQIVIGSALLVFGIDLLRPRRGQAPPSRARSRTCEPRSSPGPRSARSAA